MAPEPAATRAESDWDLLVLVDGNVDLARQGRVTEALLDLEL